MDFQCFLELIGWKKRRRIKNFQDLYDLVMKYLSNGQKQVLLGEFLLEITLPKSTEDDLRFRIKRDDRDEARRCIEEGRVIRRRFLPPDEIRFVVRAKSGNLKIEVDVSSEENSKIRRCKFWMSAPLNRLKEVFPNDYNTYVSYIVDSLLSYDGV